MQQFFVSQKCILIQKKKIEKKTEEMFSLCSFIHQWKKKRKCIQFLATRTRTSAIVYLHNQLPCDSMVFRSVYATLFSSSYYYSLAFFFLSSIYSISFFLVQFFFCEKKNSWMHWLLLLMLHSILKHLPFFLYICNELLSVVAGPVLRLSLW